MEYLRGSRNVIVVLAVFLGMTLGWTNALPAAPAATAPEKAFKTRFAWHWPPTHASAIACEDLVKRLNKIAGGRLKIDVFPSGQLFTNKDSFDAAARGAVEISGSGTTALYGQAIGPVVDLMVLRDFWGGDLLKARQGQLMMLQGGPVRKAVEQFEKKAGVKFLIFGLPGGPNLIFTGKPVRKIEDFKGLRMRLTHSVDKEFYQKLGASVVTMATSEVFTALQNGMINSTSTVISAFAGEGFWDYIKYALMPYDSYVGHMIEANLSWWNTLPKDLQSAILKAADETFLEAAQKEEELTADYIARFKKEKGGTVLQASPELYAQLLKITKETSWEIVRKELEKKGFAGVWEWAQEVKGKAGIKN